MNIWTEIQKMFTQNPALEEVVAAPNSPLISRPGDAPLAVIGSNIYTKQDVFETFNYIHSNSGSATGRGQSGVCSFAIKGLGRIRVTHITQRGSLVLRFQRIPINIPSAADLFSNCDGVNDIIKKITNAREEVVVFLAESLVLASTCAYSILQEINRSNSLLICVIEEKTTYLMRHDSSLVMQVEVATDAQSLSDAFAAVVKMEPDICMISIVPSKEDLPLIGRLISSTKCTLIVDVNKHKELKYNDFHIHERYGLSGLAKPCTMVFTNDGDRVSHTLH